MLDCVGCGRSWALSSVCEKLTDREACQGSVFACIVLISCTVGHLHLQIFVCWAVMRVFRDGCGAAWFVNSFWIQVATGSVLLRVAGCNVKKMKVLCLVHDRSYAAVRRVRDYWGPVTK